MKTKSHTFLLSLTFLFFVGCSGNGEEQEVKKEYWDNDTFIQETNYTNVSKDRIESTYYCCDKNNKKGALKWQTHYKNGKEEGLRTLWNESGVKQQEVHYKNGKQEGLETIWFETGEKMYEGTYKNGKEEGLGTGWYKTGEKRSEINYKNGKTEGLLTTWYKTGEKLSEELWKDGERQREGVTVYWYKSGKKKKEVQWDAHGDDWEVDSFEKGYITKWDEDGKKTSEERFIDYHYE